MDHQSRAELVELGLSPAEAQVYLALTQNGALSATAIADATGLSRSSVYQMLCSLVDKALVESGAGYGSKFAIVAPEEALPALVARERETLSQRERLAGRLGQRFVSLASGAETAPEELIQVVRSPQVISERFDRLQFEAERQVESLVKAPMLVSLTGNPAQEKAQKRGVRYRTIYEKAILDQPEVKAYLQGWVDGGEEARVFDGTLPHKLMIFDSRVVMLPLIKPGEPIKTLIVRYPELAQSLSLAFEFLWQQAEPIVVGRGQKNSGSKGVQTKEGKRPTATRTDKPVPTRAATANAA